MTDNKRCFSCKRKMSHNQNYSMVCENKHFIPCHKTCQDFYAKCDVCKTDIIGLTDNKNIFGDEKKLKNMRTTWKRNITLCNKKYEEGIMEGEALRLGYLKESCSSMSGGLVIQDYEGYTHFEKKWKKDRKK
jgi:hypothetical protein